MALASKKLGKFRQWAGEVISLRDKGSVTEEFRELEKDIELRRDGAQRLLSASQAYHRALSKKKANNALDDNGKLLPLDALGIIMIVHGEEFGDDSTFGSALVKFGRAHCKIATLQEAYALTLQDTFLSSLSNFIELVKEYENQRKKLESKRLGYDAALNKFDKVKGGKKEKDKKEAETELYAAKDRYEELEEDVRAQMHEIQESEIAQHRQLTSFLNTEINYVEKYLEVLQDVRSEWRETTSVLTRGDGPTHEFTRPSKEPKFSSNRSRTPNKDDSSESEAESTHRSRSRANTPSHISRRDSTQSRGPSRPSSRMSRKRSDSAATNGGKEESAKAKAKEKEDKEKEKEREKAEKAKRPSMTEWASSAVDSVKGRSKRSKDKDKFSTLDDDEDGGRGGINARISSESGRGDGADDWGASLKKSLGSATNSLSRKSSFKNRSGESLHNPNAGTGSPKIPPRIMKPPSQGRKVVRALHDFSGSSDELSFKAGDEILVVNEVLEGWWLGELGGKTGLFPTTYAEVIPATSNSPSNSNVATKTRASPKFGMQDYLPKTSVLGLSRSKTSGQQSDDEDAGKGGLLDGYGTSDLEEEGQLNRQPLSPRNSPFYSVGADEDHASATSGDEEQYVTHNIPRATAIPHLPRRNTMSGPPSPSVSISFVSSSSLSSTNSANGSGGQKKAPPPPPPRRSTVTNVNPPPLIPARRPAKPIARSHSAESDSHNFLRANTPTTSSLSGSSQGHDHGYDRSPFESATELATVHGPCGDFKQNPFKPRGMCSNCFEYHA